MPIEIVARTEADAAVADVWQVLHGPGPWPAIDALLRRVEDHGGPVGGAPRLAPAAAPAPARRV